MKPATWFTVVALIAGLAALGATSSSWFHTEVGHRDIRDGVFASEVCGFGRSEDDLEEFGRYQETGVMPPPRPWTCERELWLLQAGHARGAFLFAWASMILSSIAGLVLAAVMLVALRRRRLTRSAVVVGTASLIFATAYVVLAMLGGDYAITDLSYGAFAYVAAAAGAIVVARRWPAIVG